jgi:CheY-like chemotaxis protein
MSVGCGDTEGVRVLVVDDEPGVVAVASSYFEHRSDRFEVVTETSARAALDRLEADGDEFDCVVSDFEMPEMDGLQFKEAVHEVQSDIPFIIFTTRELFEGTQTDEEVSYLQKGGLNGGFDELVDRVSTVTGTEAT